MAANLHNDLVVLIGRLVPRHNHIGTGQVLQLVDLQEEPGDHSQDPSRDQQDILPGLSLDRRPLAHRLPALPDDTSSSEGGNLDVSLQLHLLLRPEEVLLLQFAEDSTLSLRGGTYGGYLWVGNRSIGEPGTKSKSVMEPKTSSQEGHLELSFRRSSDDDHPLFGIHSFSRSNLRREEMHKTITCSAWRG